jgi:hypothetical protein
MVHRTLKVLYFSLRFVASVEVYCIDYLYIINECDNFDSAYGAHVWRKT